MDLEERDPNEEALQRYLKLDASLSRLSGNEDFKRFIGELLCMQPLEDACFSDNAMVMAYNNGRRSLMIDIKRMFNLSQWHLIEGYDINE